MKKALIAMTLITTTGSPLAAAAGDLQQTQGVTLKNDTRITQVEVWAEGVVRITHRPAAVDSMPKSLSVIAEPQPVACEVGDDENNLTLSTAKLRVLVDKRSGVVRIFDAQGAAILSESLDGTSLQPTTVGGAAVWACTQGFELDPAEAIYGLGQHQEGHMNLVGHAVHLQQKNAKVSVPVLMSSKGYMVLWDNPAVTDVAVGTPDAGKLQWASEAGYGVDYYVFYGPELDDAVAAYRGLTGQAPMFAKWAWGLWQCKERYASQEELLGVLAEYRRRQIPLDCVIQDWQYWEPGQWGSHTFDAERFPDPAAMVRAIHEANAHTIISIWPRFDVDTANAAQLDAAGALYPPTYNNVYPKGLGRWYDAFSADGRRIYWEQIRDNLAAHDFDGWWMDGCEAELSGKWGELRDNTTGSGPGGVVYNAYPLMHTAAAYEGQRADVPNKRVFILARSGYAGQQRNAVVTWSGDIHGNWDVFAKQIPAGLNFTATGIPYWNTDIGGFFGGDPADPKYAELFTRWFQFGAFCPMFRVHGTGKGKELWRFDEATMNILIEYDKLRYHLLPYIYSVSWQVTSQSDTMMRPLVMDFREDAGVYNVADQFMFGPSIMACPVIEAGATSRKVYLPAGVAWIDFWTGKTYEGGQTINADAPRQTMPLFIKAGSIVPYGPSVQYAMEKTDPIELRIYRGADASFTFYEDEGDNYNYEQGAYATIPMHWDEQAQQLTIGQRQGSYPGMPRSHTFRIVFVSEGHGIDIGPTQQVDTEVRYDGSAVIVPVLRSR